MYPIVKFEPRVKYATTLIFCNLDIVTSDKDFKYCGNCKLALYCSKECQIHHWHKHKLECKLFVVRKKGMKEDKMKIIIKLFEKWYSLNYNVFMIMSGRYVLNKFDNELDRFIHSEIEYIEDTQKFILDTFDLVTFQSITTESDEYKVITGFNDMMKLRQVPDKIDIIHVVSIKNFRKNGHNYYIAQRIRKQNTIKRRLNKEMHVFIFY